MAMGRLQDNSLIPVLLSLSLVFYLNLSFTLGFTDSTQAGDLYNFRLSLRTDKPAYAVGEPVKITLTLTNPTDREIGLHFTSSQQFDFVVRRNETKVWRWSNRRTFSMMLTTVVLKPQSSKRYTAVWAQNDNSGHPVSLSRYEVLALLPLHQPIFSQPALIIIR